MSNPNNHVRSPQGKKIPPPVAPKPMKMTATRLMHKPVAVPPPPSSNDRTTEEDELDALTDLLVKNLEYSSDPDFFGICHKCGQKVSGEGSGCNAMDKLFHINCFVCHKCGCQLTGKVFYKVEDKAYCEADYLSSLEICWVCNKQITDRILRATGKCFHPHCFLCEECGKNLDGIPFTLDNFNKVHCLEDYYRKYSPRCAFCHQLILPEDGQDETVRIVSMNKDFHVKCFKCEDCRCQLSSEKGGSGCYPLDDHLYCQECNAKHIQQLTADLDKPQRPLTTEL
ncbi:lipoma-preferred partner homolog [Exaiptasia diaphana]|uniref:Zyxin n=1 Tax=Exaiptasia diaphana TaxID=2652724 RepID=A0A913YH93_EXADI|nr:lipoma-preferred partner homolog [Exaiptasia diaphana]